MLLSLHLKSLHKLVDPLNGPALLPFLAPNGKGDVFTVNNVTTYRLVGVFVEAIEAAERIHKTVDLRSGLSRCLRGDAMEWYHVEITQAQRNYL